jgi:hypothetical protein
MLSLLFSFILCLSSFLSYFGETVLKKTDFICFGRVEDVSRFQQNIEVGRLELKELVWTRSDFVPPAFTEKINVMGNYLGLQPQEEYLFFLKKLESRQTFKVIGKISKKTDEFFAVKYQNIRLLVELETLDSLEERKERLKVFFLENLVHSDRWVRENASTELSHFLQHSPRFLNQRDINQIKKAYFFTSDPVQKEKLKQFLQFLQKQNPNRIRNSLLNLSKNPILLKNQLSLIFPPKNVPFGFNIVF